MLAPSLSTRGTLLKFQALQMLFLWPGAWYFICHLCPHLALTISVNKTTPHSTNGVTLYARALFKHTGHTFEVSSIANVKLPFMSIFGSYSISEQNDASFNKQSLALCLRPRSLSTWGTLLKFQALQTLFVWSGSWTFELPFMSTCGSHSISEQDDAYSTNGVMFYTANVFPIKSVVNPRVTGGTP